MASKQLGPLRRGIPDWLEEAENRLTDRFRRLLHDLREDFLQLEARLTGLDHEIKALADSDPITRRLQQLRGVGPLVATALVATVGDGWRRRPLPQRTTDGGLPGPDPKTTQLRR